MNGDPNQLASQYSGPGTSAILGQPIKVLVQAHRVMEARQVLQQLDRELHQGVD